MWCPIQSPLPSQKNTICWQNKDMKKQEGKKDKPKERQMLAGIGRKGFLGHRKFWMNYGGMVRFRKANPFYMSSFIQNLLLSCS